MVFINIIRVHRMLKAILGGHKTWEVENEPRFAHVWLVHIYAFSHGAKKLNYFSISVVCLEPTLNRFGDGSNDLRPRLVSLSGSDRISKSAV
jgi:hypothetical protein